MDEISEDEVLLLSVGDEREAEMVRSLLEAHGIIALVKHRGSGDYLNIYMGMSNMGIDLFVMESDLAKAKEIISFADDEAFDENIIPEEDKDISSNNKVGLFIFLALAVFIIIGYIVNK